VFTLHAGKLNLMSLSTVAGFVPEALEQGRLFCKVGFCVSALCAIQICPTWFVGFIEHLNFGMFHTPFIKASAKTWH